MPWEAQAAVLSVFESERLCIVLKARQLGVSWLVVGFALWQMIFRPAATVLFFSQRDQEASDLVAFRLRGMWERLPDWLRPAAVVDNQHELRLANGSAALAFPTTGGRSYTASLAVVDEADHAEDLDRLLNAVKPTIDAGGRLILVSTTDKSKPESAFKRIYRGAERGESGYAPVFMGWSARPGRTEAWYAEQKADIMARTGAEDDLFQEYPATAFEAMAPRSLDRRFAARWLAVADRVRAGSASGSVAGLVVWGEYEPGHEYVIGADPAEGNPQSDESALAVVDTVGGVVVAVAAGRFEPAVFGGILAAVSERYAGAPALVERNNHEHAVLLWLHEFSAVRLLVGLDGKAGWLQTGRGKPLAFDAAADAIRDGQLIVHDRVTLDQLAMIEGSSLAAPAGAHDDRAMAVVLALAALKFCAVVPVLSGGVSEPLDIISEYDKGGF